MQPVSDTAARALSLLLPLLPGLVAGYLLGRMARKALSTALMLAVFAVAVLFLVGHFAADMSAVASWLQTASSWAGERLAGTKQYLAAILPTAAALGFGFKLGLGRR